MNDEHPCEDCILLPICAGKIKLTLISKDNHAQVTTYRMCHSCEILYDYCLAEHNKNLKSPTQKLSTVTSSKGQPLLSLGNKRYKETNQFYTDLLNRKLQVEETNG